MDSVSVGSAASICVPMYREKLPQHSVRSRELHRLSGPLVHLHRDSEVLLSSDLIIINHGQTELPVSPRQDGVVRLPDQLDRAIQEVDGFLFASLKSLNTSKLVQGTDKVL